MNTYYSWERREDFNSDDSPQLRTLWKRDASFATLEAAMELVPHYDSCMSCRGHRIVRVNRDTGQKTPIFYLNHSNALHTAERVRFR